VNTDVLTSRGEARREEILGVVLSAQRARVRRRRAVRAGVLAVTVLAVSAAAAYVGMVRGAAGVPIGGRRIAEAPAAPAPVARACLVETDPSILERVSVVSRPASGVINDDELTRLLREAGRAEGIVRVGGRAMLESEIVVGDKNGA
jgi:hypothetical protein